MFLWILRFHVHKVQCSKRWGLEPAGLRISISSQLTVRASLPSRSGTSVSQRNRWVNHFLDAHGVLWQRDARDIFLDQRRRGWLADEQEGLADRLVGEQIVPL
jgi:hypothetical protein